MEPLSISTDDCQQVRTANAKKYPRSADGGLLLIVVREGYYVSAFSRRSVLSGQFIGRISNNRLSPVATSPIRREQKPLIGA